jgi:hypothetical protein
VGQTGAAVEYVGALLLLPAGFLWLGIRARRRGLGHSVMAPWEEIWDPVAHNTHIEVRSMPSARAPAPAPGDPPAGLLS